MSSLVWWSSIQVSPGGATCRCGGWASLAGAHMPSSPTRVHPTPPRTLTLCLHRHVKEAVRGELVQHVVEEGDGAPRVAPPRAVQVDAHRHLRLLGLALHGGGARSCCCAREGRTARRCGCGGVAAVAALRARAGLLGALHPLRSRSRATHSPAAPLVAAAASCATLCTAAMPRLAHRVLLLPCDHAAAAGRACRARRWAPTLLHEAERAGLQQARVAMLLARASCW